MVRVGVVSLTHQLTAGLVFPELLRPHDVLSAPAWMRFMADIDVFIRGPQLFFLHEFTATSNQSRDIVP